MPRWLLDLGKYGVSNISLYLESDNYWVVERQKSTCHTTRLEIAHTDVLLINEFAIDHNGKCVFKFYQKVDGDIQWWNYFLPNFQCWYIMILNIYEYVVVAVDLHITTQMSESHLMRLFAVAIPIVLTYLLVNHTRDKSSWWRVERKNHVLFPCRMILTNWHKVIYQLRSNHEGSE